MKLLLSMTGAAVLALAAIGGSGTTAQAMPLRVERAVPAGDMIETVQYRYRSPRHVDRGFYRRGGYYYYNGHRGYRYARPGWRRYNDWWFPPAAFATGAIVGGIIAGQAAQAAPPPVYRSGRVSDAHVRWCYDRYRSYRASDNTFQPYNGPRQQCVSPYY